MSASLAVTAGDFKTSLRACTCPVEQWTTTNLDFEVRMIFVSVLSAAENIWFRRPSATKPGEARSITLRVAKSKCRKMAW